MPRVNVIKCQHCGGPMRRTKEFRGRGGCSQALLLVFGSALILGGIVLTPLTAGLSGLLGIVIGLVCIVVGLFGGGSRHKVWKCKHCGVAIDIH